MVNDQTGLNYWMEWHYPVLAPRTFLYPVGSATLGYAVPAAIFGLEGRRVETVDDLGGALEKALTHGGPTVLELPVAITPPWEL